MVHYTTYEGIKSILTNRTIKFNRLDLVDDITESKRYTRSECTKYTYVSCWTNSSKENIALWHMYGSQMTGFCLSLPKNPFVWSFDGVGQYSIQEIRKLSREHPEQQYYIKPIELFKSDDIFHIQCITVINGKVYDDEFLEQMNYVSDLISVSEDPLKNYRFSDNTTERMLNRYSIARHKDKDWEFQKEKRYIIQYTFLKEFVHWEEETVNIPEDYIKHQYSMERSKFLQIHKKCFNKMTIIPGPKCSEEQINEVQEIIDTNNLKIIIKPSKWK